MKNVNNSRKIKKNNVSKKSGCKNNKVDKYVDLFAGILKEILKYR